MSLLTLTYLLLPLMKAALPKRLVFYIELSSVKRYIIQRIEFKLLPSILTLQFINCPEFNFCRRYLPLDSHTNSVISSRFAYWSRWRRKP